VRTAVVGVAQLDRGARFESLKASRAIILQRDESSDVGTSERICVSLRGGVHN
jgi:hypothetical protein